LENEPSSDSERLENDLDRDLAIENPCSLCAKLELRRKLGFSFPASALKVKDDASPLKVEDLNKDLTKVAGPSAGLD
jgi:hypothetical protein